MILMHLIFKNNESFIIFIDSTWTITIAMVIMEDKITMMSQEKATLTIQNALKTMKASMLKMMDSKVRTIRWTSNKRRKLVRNHKIIMKFYKKTMFRTSLILEELLLRL